MGFLSKKDVPPPEKHEEQPPSYDQSISLNNAAQSQPIPPIDLSAAPPINPEYQLYLVYPRNQITTEVVRATKSHLVVDVTFTGAPVCTRLLNSNGEFLDMPEPYNPRNCITMKFTGKSDGILGLYADYRYTASNSDSNRQTYFHVVFPRKYESSSRSVNLPDYIDITCSKPLPPVPMICDDLPFAFYLAK